MNERTVLILGDSFVAEGTARMLRDVGRLRVISASTVEMALAALEHDTVDMLFVIGMTDETIIRYLGVLARYPALPIIRSDLGVTKVQIISSRLIDARLDLLLEAIAELPGRFETTLR